LRALNILWKLSFIIISIFSIVGSVSIETFVESRISSSEDVLYIKKVVSQSINNSICLFDGINKTSKLHKNASKLIIKNNNSELLISNKSNIIICNISVGLLVICNSTNISITNSKILGIKSMALHIVNSHNIIIEDSFINGTITIHLSSKITILSSNISTAWSHKPDIDAIKIINSSNIIIDSNSVSNLYGNSVRIYNSCRVLLLHNAIFDPLYAIDIRYSENICIYNNTFTAPSSTRAEYLIYSYLSSNIKIKWNTIPKETSSTITLSKSHIVELAYNRIYAFKVVDVSVSSIIFIHDNIMKGWYQIELGGSTLVWILRNHFKEGGCCISEPFVEVRYSELVLVERNSIGSDFYTHVHYKVDNSKKVFILYNTGVLRLVTKVDNSRDVYVLGKFLGIINLDGVLLWFLCIHGAISYPLLIVYKARKSDRGNMGG